MVDAGDADFEREVTASVPVLVDLWAPWCGPCRMVSPALERLAERHAQRLKLVKVNVDEAPAVAARYGATSIPTLVLLDGGHERVGSSARSPRRRSRPAWAPTWPPGERGGCC